VGEGQQVDVHERERETMRAREGGVGGRGEATVSTMVPVSAAGGAGRGERIQGSFDRMQGSLERIQGSFERVQGLRACVRACMHACVCVCVFFCVYVNVCGELRGKALSFCVFVCSCILVSTLFVWHDDGF